MFICSVLQTEHITYNFEELITELSKWVDHNTVMSDPKHD